MRSKLRPISVPVPRLKKDIGLGDVMRKITSAIGIPTCSGCRRRAARLNDTIVFRGTNQK